MPVSFDLVPETGSTNADLVARLAAGEAVPEGYWLVADRQTAGRGRQGREWDDGAGNFMGSTVVHIGSHDPSVSTLSFVTALAVYETVVARLSRPESLRIKWPNDVLLGGAKFCGILLERARNHAVIGVGANLVSAPRFAGRKTRSLAEYGPAPDRDTFARELAEHFDQELARWREFGLDPLFARWKAAAHPEGKPLTVHEASGIQVSGTYAGLEPDGALRLRLADGDIRVIHAGDVMQEED